MSADPKSQLADHLAAAVRTAYPQAGDVTVELERPKNTEHGDFATNVALQLARRVGAKPREVADAIVAALGGHRLHRARRPIAGPGFINLTLTKSSRFAVVPAMLAAGAAFGRSRAHEGHKIMVEFVSANPTGPLHVGHGRQAALGDAISTLLEWQGWRVTREFYYNDAGNQIANLALSVQARIKQARGEAVEMPKDGYLGDYIREIAREYAAAHFGDVAGNNLEQIREVRRRLPAQGAGPGPARVRREVRFLLPRKLALHRRQGGRDGLACSGVPDIPTSSRARCGSRPRISATTRTA